MEVPNGRVLRGVGHTSIAALAAVLLAAGLLSFPSHSRGATRATGTQASLYSSLSCRPTRPAKLSRSLVAEASFPLGDSRLLPTTSANWRPASSPQAACRHQTATPTDEAEEDLYRWWSKQR